MNVDGYRLVIGEKNYSSWSMRAWLMLRFLDLSFELVEVRLYRDGSREVVRGLGGETGLVPVLLHGNLAIWDTLAILEYLAELHGRLWPRQRPARARARSYAGELHAGFTALRSAMPVNTRGRHRSATRTPDVLADIDRIQRIWDTAGQGDGPWLFGEFCAADILFAPVATRLRTYDVALSGNAERYCQQLLQHELIKEWTALGVGEAGTIPILELPPAPAPDPAGQRSA